MKFPSFTVLTLPLLVGALTFTACGEKSETTEGSAAADGGVTIPEAPDEAVQLVADELSKGNGAVLWRAMPASYQSDVNSIAQLAGAKIDAEIYDKVFAFVSRAIGVLDKQKEFVFGTSLAGGQSDEESVAQLRAAWPGIKQIVETLTSSSIATAAGLQSFEGRAFFKETVSDLLTQLDSLAQLQPEGEQSLFADLSDVEVTYVDGSEGEAVLAVAVPGEEAETESFVRVEERWVPRDMAEQWTDQIAEARRQLESIDPEQIAKQKPQILNVFAMFDGVLAQIEAAETQEQFDQALQGAMMPLMGLMMMGQGMGGGGAAPEMPVEPALPDAPVAP